MQIVIIVINMQVPSILSINASCSNNNNKTSSSNDNDRLEMPFLVCHIIFIRQRRCRKWLRHLGVCICRDGERESSQQCAQIAVQQCECSSVGWIDQKAKCFPIDIIIIINIHEHTATVSVTNQQHFMSISFARWGLSLALSKFVHKLAKKCRRFFFLRRCCSSFLDSHWN